MGARQTSSNFAGTRYPFRCRLPVFLRTLAAMLRIENLGKRYDDHRVFEGLTYTFEPGCFALCEEHQTGKSTLLSVIAGVTSPDEGEVWIDRHSLRHAPERAKARMAYVPENCLLEPMQTGRERLEAVAREKNVPLSDDVLGLAVELGLEPHLEKRFEQMSTGTRRKVFLVAADLGEPAVVVADGPTDGLDARARAAVVELFTEWARSRVVLFASHDADFVQACRAKQVNVAQLR